MEMVKLNGTPVRVTGFTQRTIEQPSGPPLRQMELVIIVRGTMAHRSFLTLIAQEPIRIELPIGDGWESIETTIATTFYSSTGSNEAAAHRHDVTLRETDASAAARAAALAENSLQTGEEENEPEPVEAADLDDEEFDPSNPVDFSAVRLATNGATWATALKQLRSPEAAKVRAPLSPLQTSELAGAEAVLVGLRFEALLEQLAATGLVKRSVVESNFLRLVRERFVTEATPVIGEMAAQRAALGILEE